VYHYHYLGHLRKRIVVDSMLEGFLEEPRQFSSRWCQRKNKVVTYLSNLVLMEYFVFPPIMCSLYVFSYYVYFEYDI
jgi:hypothetical protein